MDSENASAMAVRRGPNRFCGTRDLSSYFEVQDSGNWGEKGARGGTGIVDGTRYCKLSFSPAEYGDSNVGLTFIFKQKYETNVGLLDFQIFPEEHALELDSSNSWTRQIELDDSNSTTGTRQLEPLNFGNNNADRAMFRRKNLRDVGLREKIGRDAGYKENFSRDGGIADPYWGPSACMWMDKVTADHTCYSWVLLPWTETAYSARNEMP